MTARAPVSVGPLRLELVPKTLNDDDQGFELRLMDAADTTIMTFTLPEGLARALAATSEDLADHHVAERKR